MNTYITRNIESETGAEMLQGELGASEIVAICSASEIVGNNGRAEGEDAEKEKQITLYRLKGGYGTREQLHAYCEHRKEQDYEIKRACEQIAGIIQQQTPRHMAWILCKVYETSSEPQSLRAVASQIGLPIAEFARQYLIALDTFAADYKKNMEGT